MASTVYIYEKEICVCELELQNDFCGVTIFVLFFLANHVAWKKRESGDLRAVRVIFVTSEPLKVTTMSETPKN